MTNLASLLKHRGCQDTRAVQIGRPLAGLRDLANSRWFVAGWGLAALAWGAHVVALSMAPISIVQAVLAGGAVMLAVLSQRLFGDPVGRRQWLALTVGAVGLVLLVVTLPRFHGSDSNFSAASIISFEGGLVLLAAGIALGHRTARMASRRGVMRAVLAGLLFALAGIAIKALTGGSGDWTTVVPLVLVTLTCGALAQYTAVAALQGGGAIETIGLMGLVANAVQIVGGVLVFGDPLSPSPLGIILQGTAFAMVCLSALLLPSPLSHRPAVQT
jgi:drug/metabolite transporter (DMT)-like permease